MTAAETKYVSHVLQDRSVARSLTYGQSMEKTEATFSFDEPKEVHFHGLKMLLRQLIDVDNELFDLSALSELIIPQSKVGTAVTVDDEDEEGDPYAYLTVLNLHERKDTPVIRDLTNYLVDKARTIPTLSSLPSLLSPGSDARVGLVISERLINMPNEIVPPLYTLLAEDMATATKAGDAFDFSHYLVLTKSVTRNQSKLDEEESRPQKKSKQGAVETEPEAYHDEDEALRQCASAYGTFNYTKQGAEGSSDALRTFDDKGIIRRGHLILIERSRFADAVKGVGQLLATMPDAI